MKVEKFEDLTFWKESVDLAEEINSIFDKSKEVVFKAEVSRPLYSISCNIAAGFERRGNNELKDYLYRAKASNGEFRSMICIGKTLGYISDKEFDSLYERSSNISRMIGGFLKSLK